MSNKTERTEVMQKQVGGDHYNKHLGLQPWDIIDEYGLNYYEGNILKYLLREKSDRVEDLQKLIHYAEKELENLTTNEITDEEFEAEVNEAINREQYIINRLRGSQYILLSCRIDGSLVIATRDLGRTTEFNTYDEFLIWLDDNLPKITVQGDKND